jgi:hypothetical protein
VPFIQDVYARTHVAKSGMDITVPPGVFTGSIDLTTGDQTGTLSLPPATVTIKLFGVLPAADASFVMEAGGPIHGHVDLATFTVDTTAAFNVRLARLTPYGTSVNLVGDGCTTTSPVTVTMHGVVNPHRRDLRQHLHHPDVRALRRAHARDHRVRVGPGEHVRRRLRPARRVAPDTPGSILKLVLGG